MVRKVLTSILAVAAACAVMVLPAVPASAATITVTNNDDAGAGSFRQAVDDAAAGDTIAFAEGLGTITLLSEVVIDKTLTITGNGQGATVLSGGGSAVLLITDDGPVNVTITDLTIDDAANDGINIEPQQGPAITVLVERVTITGSGDDAIDIDNDDGDVTLIVRDSILSGNDDDGIDVDAVGVGVSDVTVERTTIAGNDDGIVADGEGATVEVVASTISGNLDDGIDADLGATVSVVNSTISGNEESGIDAKSGGIVTVLNSTIVDNEVGGLDATDEGSVTVTNSIVHGNEPSDCSGDVTSGGGNIDGDDSCGLTAEGDQPETDPLLGALAANGGPTDTHLPLEGSPAIDAALAGPCPGTDQRGETRPQDGNDDGTAACDVGAVEVAAQPDPDPTTTTTTTGVPEIPVAPTPPGATPVAAPATAQPTFTG
jgi:hypothetical protein